MQIYKHLNSACGGIGLLIWSLATPVAAQEPPPAISPGQIERQLPAAPTEPRPAVAEPRVADDDIDIQAPTFVLTAVLVQGSTVYDPASLLPSYEPYLGRPVDLSNLEAIAADLTRRYRRDGYALTRTVVPAQTIQFGVVRIRVIEGFVSQTTMDGHATPPDGRITSYVREVERERPLRTTTLQRALLNVAALPGMEVRPEVRTADPESGSYTLVLNAEQRSFDGAVTVDNRGSDFVGPWEGVLTLRGYDLLGLHDLQQLRIATARDTDELRYAELYSAAPVGDRGAQVHARLSRLLSRPGASLEPLDVRSEASRYSVGASYPLRRSIAHAVVADLALGAYHSVTAVGASRVLEDQLYTLQLGIRQVQRHDNSAATVLQASATFGLDWGDSETTDTGQPNRRGIGETDFSKLHLRATHSHPLGRRWEMLAMLDAQVADSALPSTERYSVGGAQFGRAYDPSELTGDRGAAARLDLIRKALLAGEGWKANPYGFYDIGAAWNVDESDRRSAASAGLGVRLESNRFSAQLELARPLTRAVASEGADGDQPRWFLHLGYRF